MPAPCSEDLRWQVLWFVHVLQHSVAEASFFLGVSERTVECHTSKFLVTGEVNRRTYTQSHTPTVVQRGGGGWGRVAWIEPLPGVVDMLKHFETILPLAESL